MYCRSTIAYRYLGGVIRRLALDIQEYSRNPLQSDSRLYELSLYLTWYADYSRELFRDMSLTGTGEGSSNKEQGALVHSGEDACQ